MKLVALQKQYRTITVYVYLPLSSWSSVLKAALASSSSLSALSLLIISTKQKKEAIKKRTKFGSLNIFGRFCGVFRAWMRFLKRRIYTCDEALKKSNRRLSTLYARITFQKNKLAIGGLHRSKVNSSVRKIYILRSKRDQLRKMQLQGLLASVAHSVERWSIDIQGRAFNSQPVLHFSQLVRVGC